MAATTSGFIPALWSSKILENFKKTIFDALRPKRSPGAQLLRDAALGHKEYPDGD